MVRYKSLIFTALLLLSTGIFAQGQHGQDSTDSSDSHEAAIAREGHGQEAEEKAPLNAGDLILHHVLDNHDWHITDLPFLGEHAAITLHLPWFFYSSRDGFSFIGSTTELVPNGYFAYHEHLFPLQPGADIHTDEHGSVHIPDAEWKESMQDLLVDPEIKVYDLSITRTSFQMILVGILMLLVFMAVARGYKKNKGKAPTGIQSFLEPIILFIRDDVAKPYLGKHTNRFLPYLLSLFFFIWFANLFGLIIFSNSNIAGNISVTAALAVLTFILVNVNASGDYWKHIFLPPVPKAMYPIMIPVEIISIFTKPFALAIRLFANISAGHFMVLSLVGMIFILGKGGTSVGGALGIMPLSIGFTLGILLLEMIVAVIQAYIFTLLTSVFISMAMESHSDH